MSKGTTDLPVDPFRDREASNYENPIPSREHLLEVIRGFSTVSRDQLFAELKLEGDDHMKVYAAAYGHGA